MNHPEDALQEAVADLLRLLYPEGSPVVWFHPPLGGKRAKATAARLKRHGARKGTSDICLTWATGSAYIELKVPSYGRTRRGRLSKDQRDFMADCHRAGIPAVVCRSLTDVEMTLRLWISTRGMPEPASWARRRARA